MLAAESDGTVCATYEVTVSLAIMPARSALTARNVALRPESPPRKTVIAPPIVAERDRGGDGNPTSTASAA
jgi:hypothetical protein